MAAGTTAWLGTSELLSDLTADLSLLSVSVRLLGVSLRIVSRFELPLKEPSPRELSLIEPLSRAEPLPRFSGSVTVLRLLLVPNVLKIPVT